MLGSNRSNVHPENAGPEVDAHGLETAGPAFEYVAPDRRIVKSNPTGKGVLVNS